MLTIVCILAIASFIGSILVLMGKAPVGVVVLLLSILAVLQCLPLK